MEENVVIGEGGDHCGSRKQWEEGLAGRVPLVKPVLASCRGTPQGAELRGKRTALCRKTFIPRFYFPTLTPTFERVNSILEELEKNLTFLFRNPQGK